MAGVARSSAPPDHDGKDFAAFAGFAERPRLFLDVGAPGPPRCRRGTLGTRPLPGRWARPRTTKAPTCGAFAYMRRRGLEPPPGYPGPGPQPGNPGVISVRIAPDRPHRPETRTIRTHRTIWMLPRMLPRASARSVPGLGKPVRMQERGRDCRSHGQRRTGGTAARPAESGAARRRIRGRLQRAGGRHQEVAAPHMHDDPAEPVTGSAPDSAAARWWLRAGGLRSTTWTSRRRSPWACAFCLATLMTRISVGPSCAACFVGETCNTPAD
jgi:hypothetical protein